MHKLRILLAEDHEIVREGLLMLISSQADMEVVGQAGDGLAVVTRATQLAPDVVVMDISMPQLNGLRAIELLKEHRPGTKVLVLTRHSGNGYLRQILHCGACGYVLKQSRAKELLHGIRVVAGGGTYLDSSVSAHVMFDSGRQENGIATGSPALTAREEEVIRLVARGYSNKESAARLGLSVKTIETHKANAIGKLEIGNRVDLVRFALLQGWLEDL